MVQNILKPMSSSNYGTPATEAGNLPVQPYNTAADEVAKNATQSNVASSASSVVILPADNTRNSAILYNESTAVCYIAFAPTASAGSYTVQIPANSSYTMPAPMYQGVVSGIWASANGNMRVTKY